MATVRQRSAGPLARGLVLAAVVLSTPTPGLTTDVSSVPLPTYSTGSTVDVKPNILMVLDDSGSMDWDYLPDWANDRPSNYGSLPPYLTRNAAFNGVAYNPAITYSPPVKFNADGTKDTTTYPSMTGQATASGADASAKPNWKAVKNDGFGIQSTATSDLVNNAYSYTAVAGQYCDAPGMTNCTTTSSASGNYAYPAPLRWCDSTALTSCRALQDSTYKYPRMPAPRVATITFSSANNAVVTGITVDGFQIMSGSTASSSTNSTVADAVRDKINACSLQQTGNCTVVGYIAFSAGATSTVTILAPAASSGTPSLTKTGTLNSAPVAFARAPIPLAPYLGSGDPTSSAAVPGENLRTVITSTVDSYAYPGAAAKAASRTDCAGTTCTYAEEMTNYANWWAYYHTRMQMMKTSTSRAFSTLDSAAEISAGTTRYRVGYLSINNNTGNDFANITDFNTAQKVVWFSKLFSAIPNNSTPLRAALATAGRLYGGKYNTTTLNGTVVVDPLQFSCQRNYTILSTDGFWNGGAGAKLDGTTLVGNQDGALPRPYNDGMVVQNQTRTSQLLQRTNLQTAERGTLQQQSSVLQKMTSQLQKSTTQLQTRTATRQSRTLTVQSRTQNLQSRTQNLQSRVGTLQKRTQNLQVRTATLQKRIVTLQRRTSSNGGSTWSAWADASTCNADNNGSNQTQCQSIVKAGNDWANALSCTAGTSGANTTECRTSGFSAWTNTASCTAGTSAGVVTECQTTAFTAWANAPSCTAGSSGGVTTECQTIGFSAWANAASCTAGTSAGAVTQCQTTPFTAWANTGSCSAGTVAGLTTECQSTAFTAWVNASSCSAGTAGGLTTQCQTVTSAWSNSACTPGTAGAVTTECQTIGMTAWSNAASCTAGITGGGAVTECQTTAATAWANAGSCTAGFNSGVTSTCQYVDSAWAPAASCVPLAKSTSPNYTVGLATTCQTLVTSAFADAASCSVTAPDANGVSKQCQYSFAASTATASCAPAYTTGNYSNAAVYQNCQVSNGAWNNVSSCTASAADSSGNSTECGYAAWSAWSNVSSCSATARSAGPTSYPVGVARECQTTGATGGASDTLADVAAYYYGTDLRSPSATGADATGTCTGPIVFPATTASNLCTDNVAPYGRDTSTKQHMTTHTLGLGAQGRMVYSPYQNNVAGQRVYVPDYWNQPSGDFYSVANGSVATPASGVCSWMASGNCNWPTPASDSAANIDDLWHAAVNGRGTYFSATDPQSLSDSLKSVLSGIVNTPRPGTAAAAASSNPNVTSSDNYVFSSSYRSVEWFGELIMQQLNADGSLTEEQWSAMRLLDCATTPWQPGHSYAAGESYSQGGACYVVNTAYTSDSSFAAGTGLDGGSTSVLTGTPVSRNIYTAGTSGLVPFTWAGLTATQKDFFSTPYINYASATQGLTQFCAVGASCLSAAAQTSASGAALVDYLRGDRTNEGGYFRSRKHVLGDIVASEARYVKTPLLHYTDSGYDAFKTAKASRAAAVYVGSNDGMLHAFDATTGKENWAFVPPSVLPDLYRLADSDYASKHRFYVDGTPEVGDICPGAPSSTCTATQWRTIIVGGLNAGGKAFYALDITNPATPVYLWEFTNSNLGYSYSNPRITKLKDGTWVVIVASGYNNADGIGRLFVINASTGALIRTIDTSAGSAGTPSGLARIAARAPTAATNNTVEEVYGGDVLGNVWRFDVNGDIGAAGYDAHLLVTLTDAAGNPQPITAKPTVSTVGAFPMVMIGTGRYLGLTDVTDSAAQTMYAIKDKLDAVTLPNPRATGSNFVQQTLYNGACPADAPSTLCSQGQVVRTVSKNPVDWGINNGWYLDFLTAGERASTDATLALGTLVFTTLTPQTSTTTTIGCSTDEGSSGKSFLYYLDYLTGSAVAGTKEVGGEEICSCVSTRPSVVKSQDGSVQSLTRMSGGGGGSGTDMGSTRKDILPVNPGGPSSARRISWRELNGE